MKTQRDAWVYSASKKKLAEKMRKMIDFYNNEVERFNAAHSALSAKDRQEQVDGFIDSDPARISWTRALKQDLGKGRSYSFDAECIVPSLYRPFTKQHLYFNRRFNEMVYQMPRIFPRESAENLAICLPGTGEDREFSALMSSAISDLHLVHGGQNFPLSLHEDATAAIAASVPERCPTQNDPAENLVICITQMGGRSGFSVLITDSLPNLHVLDTVQCFPMFLYQEQEKEA